MESQSMKAVDIKGGKGSAEALFINENVPLPWPPNDNEGDQALVKVNAFGLNRMDILQREGRYPVPPQAPSILGVEFSGTIAQLSTSSASAWDFHLGDEVFGLAYGGAYAEYLRVPLQMLIHKPNYLSHIEAAGIPETYLTAIQALLLIGDFRPSRGQTVLVHAGASGVGIAIQQLIRWMDAYDNISDGSGDSSSNNDDSSDFRTCSPQTTVFVTAGSGEKITFCLENLGADYGFNYKEQSADFCAEIQRITGGKGIDLIIDFAGQSHFKRNLDVAGIDGTIILLGLLSGSVIRDPQGVDLGPILVKRLRVQGSTLRSRDLKYQRALKDMFIQKALGGFKRRKLKVFVEKVFKWEDIREAHKLMESNKTKGKIVCAIE